MIGVASAVHRTSGRDRDVEGWFLGQAGGGAVADVLFGEVNPSGRLAETVPLRLQDTPAFLDSPVRTAGCALEGLFVGYRWYDARDLPCSSPSVTACPTRRSSTPAWRLLEAANERAHHRPATDPACEGGDVSSVGP